MSAEQHTDTLVNLGRKLETGFERAREALAKNYDVSEVDRVTVDDRNYDMEGNEIGVEARFYVNGASVPVGIRATPRSHEVVYHG